jgi:hemoglobin
MFANRDIELVKEKQFRFLSQLLARPPLYNEKFGHPRMRMRQFPHRIDETEKNEWLKLMKEAVWTLNLEEENIKALYSCFPSVTKHMQNAH